MKVMHIMLFGGKLAMGPKINHIIGISDPRATTMTILTFKAFSWEKGYPVLRSFSTVLEVSWCCVLIFHFLCQKNPIIILASF